MGGSLADFSADYADLFSRENLLNPEGKSLTYKVTLDDTSTR